MLLHRHADTLAIAVVALAAFGLLCGVSQAQRNDRPGNTELQGDVNAHFGPRIPSGPATPGTPATTSPPPRPVQPPTTRQTYRITGVTRQQEIFDPPPFKRIRVEAALVHRVACQYGATIYVYQYLKRPFFRAIQPPNWGNALGGRDFATFNEAATAGCATARR